MVQKDVLIGQRVLIPRNQWPDVEPPEGALGWEGTISPGFSLILLARTCNCHGQCLAVSIVSTGIVRRPINKVGSRFYVYVVDDDREYWFHRQDLEKWLLRPKTDDAAPAKSEWPPCRTISSLWPMEMHQTHHMSLVKLQKSVLLPTLQPQSFCNVRLSRKQKLRRGRPRRKRSGMQRKQD